VRYLDNKVVDSTIVSLLALAYWLRYTYVTRTNTISKLYAY